MKRKLTEGTEPASQEVKNLEIKIDNTKWRKLMNKVPYDLPKDNKAQRLKRRYQGLSRVAAAINDLYIYGVYPSNFPNLTTVLEQAKDHCKEIIKETKAEIAFIENPNGMYDLVMDEVLRGCRCRQN